MSSLDGLALALKPGTATIHYSLSPQQVLKSHLTIQPVQHVRFDRRRLPGQLHLSSSPSQSPLNIPVTLGGGAAEAGRSHCHQVDMRVVVGQMRRLWNVEKELFGCAVDFDQMHPTGIVASQVFDVMAQVLEDGHFGCTLQTRQLSEEMQRALTPFEAHVLLSLRPSTAAPTSGI